MATATSNMIVVCDQTPTSVEFYVYNASSSTKYCRFFMRTDTGGTNTTMYDNEGSRQPIGAYDGYYFTVTGLTKSTKYAYNAILSTSSSGTGWMYSTAPTLTTLSSGSSTLKYYYKCYTTSGTQLKGATQATTSVFEAPTISGYTCVGLTRGITGYPSGSAAYELEGDITTFTPVYPYTTFYYTESPALWTATTTYQNKLSNYYSGGSTSFSFSLGAAKVGYCLFRPTKSGSITVYSSYSGTSYDMYGYLVSEGVSFDETASTVTGLFSNYLKRNDDGNGSGQFKITYNVTAGAQYRIYFCCTSKTSDSSGNIHFTFTAVNNTYTITCKDRIYNSSGVLQSTTTVGSDTYEEGETAKGSYWGTSSPYTGYEYSGCTTISSVSSNSTVYRNFYPITYTVSYNLNGVSGTTPSSTTRNYNESYTLTSTTPTNTKYTFIGWNTNPSATTGVSSETVVTDTDSITQAADITYYAIWKIKTYTVTINYNLNGGINGPSSWSQTANVGTNITTTISSTKPTKNRYNFVNWLEGNSATTYTSGQSVSFSSATTLNLYATWENKFGADNVYYGINGEWKLVETYYGVNGQWVPLKIYYGNGNQWKNNT